MKRFLAMLCILALLPISARAVPEISAPSAILMEASTGQILHEADSHARLAPASVTKVMTLLLVMEALQSGTISWNDTVTASASACAKGGSQVYLKEGEQMNMEEMVKSVVVASANDCACALAEHIAGSESAFVEKMNQRAKELGMTDTHFVNCTGLDDSPEAKDHLTSAHDIAIMSRELLKHNDIRKYTTIWMDTVRGGEFGLTNTNKLVRFYEGTTGLKTGYTSSAGYCLAASALRDGMELIAVVMHCKTSPDRFESAKALLSHGFASYGLYRPDVLLEEIPVTLGVSPAVMPVLQSDSPILLEKSKLSSVQCETELADVISAPVEQGQTLGTVTVSAGEETVATIPIVASCAVERLTWGQVTKLLLGAACGVGL